MHLPPDTHPDSYPRDIHDTLAKPHGGARLASQPSGLELFHIGGDTPEKVRESDPDHPGAIKSSMQYDLTSQAVGHPKIRYTTPDGRAYVITADVYKFEGEPFKVVLFCPMCSKADEMHTLSINGDAKKIEYERGAPGLSAMDGVLCVERFGCTWELVTKQAVVQGDHRAIVGGNLCRWRVVIENNVARDA